MGKKITLLGSTGSIGQSTLRVLRSLGNEFSVFGLACRDNIALLEGQIEEFSPSAVAVVSYEAISSDRYMKLKKRNPDIEFIEGEDGAAELAGRGADIVVSAIVGAAGLNPTLRAIGSSGRIALANKETLVMAGSVFMERIKESDTVLIPVDSEHSAVFSLTRNIPPGDIRRVILTASGGSLREVPLEVLSSVTVEQALEHPTWSMGDKITIDSATLMNKGLEVIEAHHLFGFNYDDIDVIIHPESAVHSMIETVDGSIYAHMGIADMALPILNALTYPDRTANSFGRLSLEDMGRLTFHRYDRKRYPALDLCYGAGKEGGTMPAVLNAANEIAVGAFLKKKILFTDIIKVVEKTINSHSRVNEPSLEEIIQADREARDISLRFIKGD